MDWVSVGIGVLAIAFGSYTAFLRATNSSKLDKLQAMQKAMGTGVGSLVHLTAYSLLPIAVGVFAIVLGMRGESLF